jgi:ABC-2 type transport system permease protein
MGRLIKAEFRKILTTKLWWGLLIPTIVLAFAWSFGVGKLIQSIGDGIRSDDSFQRLGISVEHLSLGVFALSRGINIATIFPMLFGALGLSSEIHRRTITTTFLTAPNRMVVLSAKAITYVVWGLIYGVVIAALVAAGTAAGTGGNYLPDAGGFLLILLAGVLSCLLWTLLGLGVGALLGSTTGAVVLLLIYAVIVEPVADLFLHNSVVGFLPNGAADGLTGSTAGQILIDQLQSLTHTPLVQVMGQHDWDTFLNIVRVAAGAIGASDWWISGLIFLAWAAIFFGLGLFRNQQRDIT